MAALLKKSVADTLKLKIGEGSGLKGLKKPKMEVESKIKRSKNWSEQEKLTLVKLVTENHEVLFGELTPELTAAHQKKTWNEIGRQITK
jgi:hypothetical protein